jgi:threonine dehydratase
MSAVAPSFEDIEAAARRLEGVAVKTPLVENPLLNEMTGGRILMKAECLQLGGAFKFRGAYNLLSQIPAQDRQRGVVAYSSGNHAQGVARAGKMLGIATTIVMPEDAPAIKTDMVRRLGATIVAYNRYTDDREAIAAEIVERTGATVAPPFDHPEIIAGQGVTALEAAEQAGALGLSFDSFLVCCGGGGLSAGCGLALEGVSPGTEIVTVEPEGYDDWALSFQSGARERSDVSRPTICDSIATATPGKLTFPILRRLGARGVVITDDEAAKAVAFAFRHLKLVLEPGGAAALSAVLSGRIETEGAVVGLTLSGGNLDPGLMARILTDHATTN